MTEIVEIKGGLGNQLFQLAFANWLAHRRPDQVFVDLDWFRRKISYDTPRELEVNIRDLTLPVLGGHLRHRVLRAFSIKASCCTYYEAGTTGGSRRWRARRHTGFYQDHRFVRDSREFLEPLFRSHLIAAPRRSNSVTVHCRLGDYVSRPSARTFHGVTDPLWSFECARRLKEKYELDSINLFTDSPEMLMALYAEEIQDFKVHFNSSAWETLGEMLCGRAFVLSNSSFSWWAATASSWFLDPPAEVIFPVPWFAEPSVADSELFNPEWTAVDRDILDKVETEGA